jgi:F0F1-type ATP synthase membrane subunit a
VDREGRDLGVPTKRQAFVEVVFEFITEPGEGHLPRRSAQVRGPAGFTVFVWVILHELDGFPAGRLDGRDHGRAWRAPRLSRRSRRRT